MLTLTRKVGERIIINGDIVIEVKAITRKTVRLGVKAPKDVSIYREELLQKQESTTDPNDPSQ